MTDDAIAYAKVIAEFLKTHDLGRTEDERAGHLLRIGIAGAHDLGHDDVADFFTKIVIEKLREAGAIDLSLHPF
jgi:hypothetical protein